MKKKVLKSSLSVILSLALVVTSMVSFAIATEADETNPLPEPVKVVDFSKSFEELKAEDASFEVVENAAAPTLVQDEEMGQVLKLGKAVIKGQQMGNGGNLIADESEYSTINIANPYKGKTELVEYEDYEDVNTTLYRGCQQPDWKTGVTISYWIKTPGVNSNVIGFNSDQYLIQADDYAKHLCTIKYDVDYAKYTEEEKNILGRGVPISGVGMDSDFYFEYAEEGQRTVNGFTGYVLNDSGAAGQGKWGRIYWMGKNYVKGLYWDDSASTYKQTEDNGSYEGFHLAPIFDNENQTFDLNDSALRFAWTHSEMWLDASSSFYFHMDNSADRQLNPNHANSYDTIIGCQNGNCFAINSWKSYATFEEAQAAESVAPSPMSQPDEWHYITAVIQNDWVLYYIDGEEIDIEENYSSYGTNGLAHAIGNEKPWKRFNKGTGTRYGYGTDKTTVFWCFYGNYVTTTIMQWLTAEETDMTIGGGNINGDGYNMFANTDEVQIKNVVFYDKMLDEDQIEFLADQPHYYESTPGLTGDVNLDENVDAKDALLVLQSVAKLATLTDEAAANADVNADTNIDAKDALGILQVVAKIYPDFEALIAASK